ncbi:PhnE/PtxC family ABC transporter permease [Methyloraptor flagellatus]|uniref:ABC transporter permease n=1 Tax=Methyloraptor flagellatus TaxID=3162530 RepID=A0AAU7XI45_9HYPH
MADVAADPAGTARRSVAPESGFGRRKAAYVALALAALTLPFADLAITTTSPGRTALAILSGFAHPDFSLARSLASATASTLAVAFVGVGLGATIGFGLALLWRLAAVRALAACLRGVHELIWALFLMTVTGPTATTAVTALALAYAGIFAKVFGEIVEETDRRPAEALARPRSLSAFFFAVMPLAAPQMRAYLSYRIECGIRSSAVLGFVGLPTLGFELDTLFKQADYAGAAAVLIATYAAIATIPFWLRRALVPLYLAAALVWLAVLPGPPVSGGSFLGLAHDLIPAPLRSGDLASLSTWARFGDWLRMMTLNQIAPGLAATLVLGWLAIVATGAVALLGFPFGMPAFVGRLGAGLGHLLLVVLRSTPEYMLVFVGVQMLGPSMLPAIVALALHNGAIIAHLMSRQGTAVVAGLRPDRPRGPNLWGFELLPRLASGFYALVLYRGEIILRESAILGVLGVATIGFHIDSAISELRLDRAFVLLLAMIAMTAAVDRLSRALRRRLGVASVSMS